MSRRVDIERALRARIEREAPPASVIELFGWREEHNHVRGCPIRAGSHDFACTCRELVAVDVEIWQTIRALEARLERICKRVEGEIDSFAHDRNGRELWLARGDISMGAAALERGNPSEAKSKLALAAERMDRFEAGECARAEDAALARFGRDGA